MPDVKKTGGVPRMPKTPKKINQSMVIKTGTKNPHTLYNSIKKKERERNQQEKQQNKRSFLLNRRKGENKNLKLQVPPVGVLTRQITPAVSARLTETLKNTKL